MPLIRSIKRRLMRPRKDRWDDVVAENINILHDSIDVLNMQLRVIEDFHLQAREALLRLEDEQGRVANCVRELKLKVK